MDGGDSKAIYCGNWRDGDKYYFGTYFWNEAPKSTDFFLGLYKDDRRQDQGLYVYESGKPKFQVQATDYYQSGINNLIDNDSGDLVSGCRAGDCQNGFGIYRYSDGDVYEGYFLDGQRHGWGTYFYNKNGKAKQVYSGHWRNGDKHHFGAHFWNGLFQGDFFFGIYKNNVRQKHGVYVDEDGQASFHNITTSNAYKKSNDLLVMFLKALFSGSSNYEYEDSSYRECHACNGSGSVYSGGMVVNCGTCNGTGRK